MRAQAQDAEQQEAQAAVAAVMRAEEQGGAAAGEVPLPEPCPAFPPLLASITAPDTEASHEEGVVLECEAVQALLLPFIETGSLSVAACMMVCADLCWQRGSLEGVWMLPAAMQRPGGSLRRRTWAGFGRPCLPLKR